VEAGVGEAVYDRVFEIVGRVLRCGAIEPALDFFDHGANSLAVVQIVELVRVECGVDIWLADAFDAPDIESFAQQVAATVGTEVD
jgi:acyl carrier protein